MDRARALVAIVIFGSLSAGCGTPTAADDRVAIGTWAGDHMRLDVAAGSATTEYDCAHGTIDEPIVPDRDGRFSAAGTHTFEHGGPVRLDEPPDRHPARYVGRLSGTTIDLTVTIVDSAQTFGPFRLTFGGQPRLLKCL